MYLPSIPHWFGIFLVINSILWITVSLASFRQSLPAAGLKCYMVAALMYSVAFLTEGFPVVFWIGISTVLVALLVSTTLTIVAAHQTLQIMKNIRSSIPKNPSD